MLLWPDHNPSRISVIADPYLSALRPCLLDAYNRAIYLLNKLSYNDDEKFEKYSATII